MEHLATHEGDMLAWTMAFALERCGDYRAALDHLEASMDHLPPHLERLRARNAARMRADGSSEPRAHRRRPSAALTH